MKKVFTITNVSPNPEIHGDETMIGIAVKLRGIVDEELLNRFAFGASTGAVPKDVKGAAKAFFWQGNSKRFHGWGATKLTTKFMANVKIGNITLNKSNLSKASFTVTPVAGQFELSFQVYNSHFKKGDLEKLVWLSRTDVECDIKITQTDVEGD